MKTVWGLKRLRKRMFKDLERVIKARNLVLYNDVSEYSMVEVAKKIEELSKHYAQAIGIMKEQLQLAEDNGYDIESSRFLYNYRALKDDTVEVVSVMFEMYTDVYNKIQEVMCDE
jgi:hypothetical protein